MRETTTMIAAACGKNRGKAVENNKSSDTIRPISRLFSTTCKIVETAMQPFASNPPDRQFGESARWQRGDTAHTSSQHNGPHSPSDEWHNGTIGNNLTTWVTGIRHTKPNGIAWLKDNGKPLTVWGLYPMT
jgi:hypothetical protein